MGPFRDAGRDPAWQERQVDDFLTRLDTAVGVLASDLGLRDVGARRGAGP